MDQNKSVQELSNLDSCIDITSQNLPSTLEEIEFQIDRLKRRWNEFTYLIGQRLKIINDNKLYKESGYNDFGTYIKIALKMSENNAYYYIAIYEYFTEEQTKMAGSKLKLIIPILNKVKRDDSISEEQKNLKMIEYKEDLYSKIYNKSYRDAEKIVNQIKNEYFNSFEGNDKQKIKMDKKYLVKDDKIIIYERNKEIRKVIIDFIEDLYR